MLAVFAQENGIGSAISTGTSRGDKHVNNIIRRLADNKTLEKQHHIQDSVLDYN